MATTKKRLFIPRKTAADAHNGYGTDMRAIENFNPINKLIAGSGVTLLPADGTGPEVEISASGGGGGTGKWGLFQFQAGMDQTINPSIAGGGSIWMGEIDQPTAAPQDVVKLVPPGNISSSSVFTFTFSMQWIVFPIAGASMVILPGFEAPNYTFGLTEIKVACVLNAWSFDSNQVMYAVTGSSPTIVAPPSTFVQTHLADYTVDDTVGADLTFTDVGGGTGGQGGFVTAGGGGALGYFGSTQFILAIPDDVVFT